MDNTVIRGLGQLDALASAHGGSFSSTVAAIAVADAVWPSPEPLSKHEAPADYPHEHLPLVLRNAVEEVATFTQAPIAMVAGAALSSLSIAAQAYFDVERAEKLQGPIGIFLLVLADSGERKSSCDKFFKQPIVDFEAGQALLAKPEKIRFKSEFAAWEAVRAGLLEKIKLDTKNGKDSDATRRALEEHEANRPIEGRVPRLLYSDFTPEKLTYNLAKIWPSGGVLSSEAGAVLGSHSMTGDTLMRTLAILNQLWDGAPLTFDRKTSESFSVRGARFSMALQIQPAALQEFVERSGGLARDIGFFARFLVCWPQSTQGTRFYKDAPATWPYLIQYHLRIRQILEVPPDMDDDGALKLGVLTLDVDAKAAWIAFHDSVEAHLAEGGELTSVRDVASKIADNAVRLAALFHIVQDRTGPICFEDFDNASMIALWHLQEAVRFFGVVSVNKGDQAARRLDAWLIDHCNSKSTESCMTTEVMRFGPPEVRNKAGLRSGLTHLADLGRVRTVTVGRSTEIFVNPALLRSEK